MRDQSLKGKIAVVTGSDSGIGQATAIACAREGADVAITYLGDREGAEHTRKLVEEAGQKAVVMPLDQTQPEQIDRLFQETQQQLGIPTILVNNAGLDPAGVPVKDMPYIHGTTLVVDGGLIQFMGQGA